MAIIALLVGSVPIVFTSDFEQQGFAVTEVTGLSEYGDHKMGVPGSAEIVINGVVLPGANPMDIRAYIFGSTNPYTPFNLQAIHRGGKVLHATALIRSIKCDTNVNPTTIIVTIVRQSGWFGDPIVRMLGEGAGENNKYVESDVLNGVFEFTSPVTIEVQLISAFSQSDLMGSKIRIWIGDLTYIAIDFERLVWVINKFSAGLNLGSVIRVVKSLDYSAYLMTANRLYNLPVMGDVNGGMIPVGTDPVVRLESDLPPNCAIQVVVRTRETYLTV